MNFRQKSLLPVLIAFLFLAPSCNKMPDHAHYIPKDAFVAVGLNTKALTKKVAWSTITGSKLIDEIMTQSSGLDQIKNLEKAGVDPYNTFYTYIKGSDKRSYVVTLIPLKNAMTWESFMKATFNGIVVKELKNRKEARISENVYAGWTNNLMIFLAVSDLSADATAIADEESSQIVAAPVDEALLSSYLESAFNVTAEHSVIEDKRFKSLENANYDLEFWVNTDALMSAYGSQAMASYTGGFGLADKLWKNTVFAAGVSFDKGRIVADLIYYASDDMKEVYKEYGKENVDKEFIQKLPGQGLDYLMAFHLSPEGLKKMLEKMNLTGLANMALAEQKTSLNEILGAFNGDMILAVNNFSVSRQRELMFPDDSSSAVNNYKTDMDVVFALKLNNRQSFIKLLDMAVASDLLVKVDDQTYTLKSNATDTPIVLVSDKYAVIANKGGWARAFAVSDGKKQNMPMIVKDNIYGRPFGMFVDFQEIAKGLKAYTHNNTEDSVTFAEAAKTFENYVLNGGKYENDAFRYKMSLNFVNKDENSLLQILNMALHIKNATVSTPVSHADTLYN